VLAVKNLEVPEGNIVALLSANGAGKTTLLRAICGPLDITSKTKGTIEWE
jgi:ABC-type branched-subunit amino acid transport system ATPase component